MVCHLSGLKGTAAAVDRRAQHSTERPLLFLDLPSVVTMAVPEVISAAPKPDGLENRGVGLVKVQNEDELRLAQMGAFV